MSAPVAELRADEGTSPLLEIRDLKKHFPIYKGVFSRVAGQVYAVDGQLVQHVRAAQDSVDPGMGEGNQ